MKNLRDTIGPWLSIVFLSCLISACGESSTSDDPAANAQGISTIQKSDIAIAQKVYRGKRVPETFYQQSSVNNGYAIIHHVKNSDITSQTNGLSYELCTDNESQAAQWSQAAAARMAFYYALVEQNETELYYEFVRNNPSSPQIQYINRIFKCAYLDRSQSDQNYGIIHASPAGAQQLGVVIEYLWFFSQHNNYGYAVLETVTAEDVISASYTLTEAVLHQGESCDTIDVVETYYQMNKNDGVIHVTQQLLRQFSAQRDGNTIRLCQSD